MVHSSHSVALSLHSLLSFLTFATTLVSIATLHVGESPSDSLHQRPRHRDIHRREHHPRFRDALPIGAGSTNDVLPNEITKKATGSTRKNPLPSGNRSLPAEERTQTSTEERKQTSFEQCFCNEPKSKPRSRLKTPPKRAKGKVIMIVVCEHMAGMLQASLACNQALVDRVVVITSPEDMETQRMCISKGIECRASKELHRNGDAFNKGGALKEMQIELHKDPKNINSTILLVDVDVCLPSDMWKSIPKELDNSTIYSVIDRCMFANHTDYSRGWPAVRGRWSNNVIDTLGMFQMYTCAANAPLYSEGFSNASVSDLEFASRFQTAAILPIAVNHMGVSPDYAHWMGQTEDTTSGWADAQPPPDGICPCCDID